MANVRFYRLETLPSFEVPKHQGIFVHVTSNLTRIGKEGNYIYSWGELDKDVIPNIVIQKIVEKETTRPVLVPEWMDVRRINTVASGLWFGGENGWELLSNDTTSGAIDAAIDAKIQELDVNGYAQATITTDTPAEGVPNSSTLTIKGIQEVDGRIGIPADSENLDLDIAIDGVYSQSNKIATQSTVTTAINGLNVDTIQAVTTAQATDNTDNTVLTFNGIKEEKGKIKQGDGATTFTVGNAKLKIQIGSAAASDVFSANAQADSTIQLNGYVFKKDGDVISVITPTAVSESNKLVTQQDVANLAGAMYYKGAIASDTEWPTNENVKAGYVWIASGNFEHGNESIESGDLIVFNTDNVNTDYTVVQSNITLGVGDGQVAANVGALADGKLVVGVNPATGSKGIKTVDFDVTNLTGTTGKNERTLSIANGTADTLVASLYHDVTITDALTVIGKPFTKSIKISSPNRSIEIAANASENATGVVVDLVWNTSIE